MYFIGIVLIWLAATALGTVAALRLVSAGNDSRSDVDCNSH